MMGIPKQNSRCQFKKLTKSPALSNRILIPVFLFRMFLKFQGISKSHYPILNQKDEKVFSLEQIESPPGEKSIESIDSNLDIYRKDTGDLRKKDNPRYEKK